MYLVDTDLIDMIIARTNPNNVKWFARLAPSMAVKEVEWYAPEVTFQKSKGLADIVRQVTGANPAETAQLRDEYDTYVIDTTSLPTILLGEDDVIEMYHTYTPKKELYEQQPITTT